jgi:hypothetical protein
MDFDSPVLGSFERLPYNISTELDKDDGAGKDMETKHGHNPGTLDRRKDH